MHTLRPHPSLAQEKPARRPEDGETKDSPGAHSDSLPDGVPSKGRVSSESSLGDDDNALKAPGAQKAASSASPSSAASKNMLKMKVRAAPSPSPLLSSVFFARPASPRLPWPPVAPQRIASRCASSRLDPACTAPVTTRAFVTRQHGFVKTRRKSKHQSTLLLGTERSQEIAVAAARAVEASHINDNVGMGVGDALGQAGGVAATSDVQLVRVRDEILREVGRMVKPIASRLDAIEALLHAKAPTARAPAAQEVAGPQQPLQEPEAASEAQQP